MQISLHRRLDDWSIEEFKTRIYNDEYKLIDPEYQSARARANADTVARLWGAVKAETRVLDCGGGNGAFCAALRDAGFSVAVTFDPLVPEHATPPEGKFGLVTSLETFEHMPEPNVIEGIGMLTQRYHAGTRLSGRRTKRTHKADERARRKKRGHSCLV